MRHGAVAVSARTLVMLEVSYHDSGPSDLATPEEAGPIDASGLAATDRQVLTGGGRPQR